MPRHERKMVLPHSLRSGLNSLIRLHPARFCPVYHPRFVNNIYFDTPLFRSYLDSSEGLSRRYKVRIRWYGDMFGEIVRPVLELKGKSGGVGTKRNYTLPAFDLHRKHIEACVAASLKDADLPDDMLQLMAAMQPVLMNRYRREYWRSADGNYRLTVDSDLQFFALIRFSGAAFQTRRDHGKIVVEMKYDAEYDSGMPEIAQHFPLRWGKCSKYVMGIERLYRGYADIPPD